MSRRTLASQAQVAAVDALALTGTPAVRIPDRIVLDLVTLFEVALVAAAAVLAEALYIAFVLDSHQHVGPYLLAGIAGGILTHYVLRARGLTQPAAILEWRKRLVDVVISIAFAFLALIAIAYLFKVSEQYSRGWLLTWLALVSVALPLSRSLSASLMSWLSTSGYTARRIAIVADAETGRQIAARLGDASGTRIVGIFQDTAGLPGDAPHPYRTIADLISIGQRNQIDEVVVALSQASKARMARLIDDLSVLPVDVSLCAPELDLRILNTARLGGVSLLQVNAKPIRDWGYLRKLTLDYVLGSVALVLLSPVMLLVAAAIKLDSPGPVLFRQRRHGYNHRVIDVYKFRTMTVTENGDRIEQARKDDPRVTRIGRFLRSTSLDELPQLFNVLKGEMSLVGPRPHALAHNQLYREQLERYANRHCVKPGMTGWAQINGLRGPTENAEKMRQRVELDLYYIENWSLLLDLKIIALTPFLGFVHRNAL